MTTQKKKAVGYDKYVDWKMAVIPVALMIGILLMPPTEGMRDVGTEYSVGSVVVKEHFAQELFNSSAPQLEQWQKLVVNIMEESVQMGSFGRKNFLERSVKWCKEKAIPVDEQNLAKAKSYVEGIESDIYRKILNGGAELRTDKLKYEELSPSRKAEADKATWKLKAALAVMVFTIICFLTGCVPLPAVAFIIGLMFVFTGIVGREEVAALYWNDAAWFIMGSLMFAAAFVKTGVDKRLSLLLFNKLARPSVGIITLVMIAVIAPLASFISDHALAAIFLPIALLLYRGSQREGNAPDTELAKMLLITVAMGCNIGGFGAPSGGARNVIMMGYLNDMFGMDIGYLTWVTYAMPFVIIMIPFTWLMIQWRFKPSIRDLSPSMKYLREEVSRMGKWNRQQIVAVIIFVVMLWFWFTEKIFFNLGIYPIRLGIGVVAVAGGIAYIMTGIVNWRDYQEKVDWGVVWLYAGAIIFGTVLDHTGAAYYIARSAIDLVAGIGIKAGTPLILVGNVLTSLLTQLMADGPAAAAVGPITLNMAGLVHPGTAMLPFMTMATACASSFAYILIIGTPPNAIVYASGMLEPKDYLRVGVPLWIVANIVLAVLISTYWAARGFAGLPGF